MSIFSKVFLAITVFIANLWGSTKSEWNKLAPEVQADFQKAITWGNLIKGYVLNPSTAPGALDVLITTAEGILGPVYMGIINAALNEALIDAGIVQEAFTDPKDAYTALITHLKSFGPNSVGDQIGVWVSNIVGKIVNDVAVTLNNNQVKVIIAFVYDTFFKVATPPINNQVAQPEAKAIESTTTYPAVNIPLPQGPAEPVATSGTGG